MYAGGSDTIGRVLDVEKIAAAAAAAADEVTECTTTEFDITATADLYSALAGVLAGFAFTALMMLLSRHAGDDPRDHHLVAVVKVLLATVIALSLSALTYGGLGGEPISGGRAAAEQMIAGVGFTVGGLLFLYSIALTIDAVTPAPFDDDVGLGVASRYVRRVLVHGIVPLFVLFLGLSADDFLTVRDGAEREASFPDYLLYIFAVATIVLGFGLSAVVRRRPVQRAPTIAATASVVIVIGTAAAYGIYTAQAGRCDVAPDAVMYAAMVANFVTMAGAIPLIASRPQRRALG